jgi:acyl CoA:acetate/3-ketoacid CoA transferase beta subunit
MTEGKVRLEDQTVALRVAKEFEDGMVVNLGGGLPTLASNFVPEGKEVLFHSENGMLGFGRTATKEELSWHLFNASSQPVTYLPGMSFFHHDESFCMIRGRHIDVCVLGGLQVSEKGDLANWARGSLDEYGGDISKWIREGKFPPAIGGAMDLALGANKIIVAMTHTTKDGGYKIVRECSYEITAKRCVSLIITDVAVIEVTDDGLLLKEVAPGFSAKDVQELTEPKLLISSDLKEIEL